jgi:hypothetical protein
LQFRLVVFVCEELTVFVEFAPVLLIVPVAALAVIVENAIPTIAVDNICATLFIVVVPLRYMLYLRYTACAQK